MFIKSNNRVAVTGELLSVEMVSDKLTDSMIDEFGIYKTALAIQTLYDADLLSEEKARAMLDCVNIYIRFQFSFYGECYGNEKYEPIKLH